MTLDDVEKNSVSIEEEKKNNNDAQNRSILICSEIKHYYLGTSLFKYCFVTMMSYLYQACHDVMSVSGLSP